MIRQQFYRSSETCLFITLIRFHLLDALYLASGFISHYTTTPMHSSIFDRQLSFCANINRWEWIIIRKPFKSALSRSIDLFFLVFIVFVNSTSFPFYGRNEKPFFFKVCVFLFIYCSNLLNCVINFILILSVMLWITVFVACIVHVQSEFSISSLVKLTRQNI